MVQPSLTPLIIAGPTASGKSDLAIKLALRQKGEIVCADSRQFYQGMEIGTCAPSVLERSLIPHHGFSSLDPLSPMNAGQFVEWAQKTVAEIQNRNKRPILVGGTGLYLRALRYGLMDVPKANPNRRAELLQLCEQEGPLTLHQRLQAIDPKTASGVPPSDSYRVLRALEIFYETNQKPSEIRQSFSQKKPIFEAQWMVLWPDKDWLWERIKARVQNLFSAGLIAEVLALKKHLPPGHPLLETMGYKEALQLASGEISLVDAISLVAIRHRQYAKRQFTWFKKEDYYTRLDPKTDAISD